jgi:hypothetical protein
MSVFLKGRIVDFIILMLLSVSTWLATVLARKGKVRELRPLPALEAISEGIGRSAEMNRPVYMTPGMSDVGTATTIAGLAVLDVMATQCAKLDVPLLTVFGHGALGAAEMIVAEAYRREGKAELYSPGKQVLYFSTDQYAHTAGEAALFQREKPGLCVFIGNFYSEILYLGEAAARVGAMQIGGTHQQLAIPMMAVTMDYILIGEEMYAMAASITRDPVKVGSILAQDIGKIFLFGISIIGVIAMLFGSSILIDWLNT